VSAVQDTPTVRAQAKWVHASARKARLVTDLIRGRSVPEARTILAFSQRAVARDVEKVLRSAVANAEFAVAGSETRLVEVGESAGPTITLPAAVLRSAALTILGTAGIPPREVLTDALQQVMNHAAQGLLCVDSERVALRDIERAWERDVHGRRLVVIP